MAAYWEIAAHSAYEMCSKYKYLIVNLVFPHLGFLEWEFLSDCAFFYGLSVLLKQESLSSYS